MKMNYFPFTFLFNVPGLSNPFASSASAPAAAEHHSSEPEPVQTQTDLKRLIRVSHPSAPQSQPSTSTARPTVPPYRKRPPPSSSPPAPLVRKRAWQPSSAEPSHAAVIKPSASGIFDRAPEHLYQNMSTSAKGKDSEADQVDLDLPPAKRRKGITGSVLSTAFNAALVGAAVGLTVFRLWKDRGKEVEQSPPPPYQEEWAKPSSATIPDPEPQPSPHVQKTHASLTLHRRHAGSMRHRQKAIRKPVHIRRDKHLSPNKPTPQLLHEEFIEQRSSTHGFGSEDDTLDEMDWIGDRLAQLIEEGQRALGKEIVVSSEAPEDEVDDGSGNWVEDQPEASSSSLPFSSPRRVPTATPSKRLRHGAAYSLPNSGSPHLSTFPSHSRFRSDDLTADVQADLTGSAVESNVPSAALLSRTYESESPSIRESMEVARAAYLQKRGLAIDIPGGMRF